MSIKILFSDKVQHYLGRRVIQGSIESDITLAVVTLRELDSSIPFYSIGKLRKIEIGPDTEAMFSSIRLPILELGRNQSIRDDDRLGDHPVIHMILELNALIPGNLLNFIQIQAIKFIIGFSEFESCLRDYPGTVEEIGYRFFISDDQRRFGIIDLTRPSVRSKGYLLVINNLQFAKII